MSDADGADGLGELFDGDDESDRPDKQPADDDTEAEVTHRFELQMDAPAAVFDITRHRNGDVTAVVLLDLADGYQALGVDVDGEGEILATEEIGSDQEESGIASMCKYWVDQNPKGIVGAEDAGGGLLGGLFGGGGG